MERPNVSKQRFLIVTLLNVLITVVEIIGGLVSGSLHCFPMPFTT